MSKLYVAVYDLHYPKYNKACWGAVLKFLEHVEVDGFIFGGDQFDNECISHHTKNKPGLRERNAFKRDEVGFETHILAPLEARLGPDCEKVWIVGNHERFEQDLCEEQPELEGIINHAENLGLRERGWKNIPLGHAHKLGKLNVIHGEILTGIGNQAGMYPSRKAVELYAGNVLSGHTHSPQSFTKVSPVEHAQKWQGHIAPICGDVNPGYLRNRPTAWLNGFVIVELRKGGDFNLYPVIVSNGKFSWGGKDF